MDAVTEGLEDREVILAVFLDLAKAFDCVNHDLLADILFSCGIRGLPLLWLKSYLSDRTQQVCVSDDLSESLSLKCGVPQGSILGPVLFLIYVNKLNAFIRAGSLVQFVDDTNLCFRAKTKAAVEIQAFVQTNSCVQHFQNLNLRTNSSKSKSMVFKLGTSQDPYTPAVMVVEDIIDEVDHIKYLGIETDNKLNWSFYIENICRIVSSGIFLLRSLSDYCDISILKSTYYGVIFPHICYGIILWGGCGNVHFQRIFVLQKKAIRIIANLNYRDSCREVFRDYGFLTLPCIYIYEMLVYCVSKMKLTQGSDIHGINTRHRNVFRQNSHRLEVSSRLPAQAGVRMLNQLPDDVRRYVDFPKLFKTHLKRFLVQNAFYSVDEFMEYNK